MEGLEEGGTYIKPFVTVRNSSSMAGGVNFLNKVSVPWELTCDEIIYCHQGQFRLVVDEESFVLNPGDMMFVPSGTSLKYEADDKCMIFYAAWPVDWKQRAGLTEVPGIDPEDM
jgi:ethanolamine utilization protein EutQ